MATSQGRNDAGLRNHKRGKEGSGDGRDLLNSGRVCCSRAGLSFATMMQLWGFQSCSVVLYLVMHVISRWEKH